MNRCTIVQTTNTFWTQVLSMELMYGTGMMDGSTMMPYSSTMMDDNTADPDSGSSAVTAGQYRSLELSCLGL